MELTRDELASIRAIAEADMRGERDPGEGVSAEDVLALVDALEAAQEDTQRLDALDDTDLYVSNDQGSLSEPVWNLSLVDNDVTVFANVSDLADALSALQPVPETTVIQEKYDPDETPIPRSWSELRKPETSEPTGGSSSTARKNTTR